MEYEFFGWGDEPNGANGANEPWAGRVLLWYWRGEEGDVGLTVFGED